MTEKLTQSDFAALQGVNRATVTRWKQAGRLVMAGELVDVPASQARLLQTNGGRDDVAARHAANREQPTPPPTEEEKRALESRAGAQARKESALADLAELDYRQKMGQVVDRAEVDALFSDVTVLFRQLIENQAHRIAGNLVQKDFDFIRGALKQDAQEIIGSLWKEADKKSKELGGVE